MTTPPPPIPGLYRHYKGNLYRVLGVTRHSETQDLLVLYQALYGSFGLWSRPVSMFCETVEINGVVLPRFELVTPHASPLDKLPQSADPACWT